MCGIAGFITAPASAIVLKTITKKMVDMIVHRGPDDSGIWVDENCQIALGHQPIYHYHLDHDEQSYPPFS
jgi:asparagine synthase (glutamine-hydrolysing)